MLVNVPLEMVNVLSANEVSGIMVDVFLCVLTVHHICVKMTNLSIKPNAKYLSLRH